MYQRTQPRAAGHHSAATEQLGHYLFVGEPTGSAGCQLLIMLLPQHRVGLRRVEVISRSAVFERPQPPVFIDQDHHRGLARPGVLGRAGLGIQRAERSRFPRRERG
jgi:hypothetical protein